MRFKSFEFKQVSGYFNKYELVKWKDNNSYFTLGWIEYNSQESIWEFRGCGLRYQEYYEEGLNEFVLKYVELLDLQKKYHDKEVEEFYEHY